MLKKEEIYEVYECCQNPYNRHCDDCPVTDDCLHDNVPIYVLGCAVTLLKEQQKTGHWIPLSGTADNNGVRVTSFRCSECGERTDRVDTNRHINFCPMCGTRMLEA